MNKAIGWLIIVIAVGIGIDSWHNQSPWQAISDYIKGTNPNPNNSEALAASVPGAPAGAGFRYPNLAPSVYNPALPSNPNFVGPPAP